MGTRTGLDDVEWRNILLVPRLEIRPLGRPARSCTDRAFPLLECLNLWTTFIHVFQDRIKWGAVPSEHDNEPPDFIKSVREVPDSNVTPLNSALYRDE
jgi:hypothetical protein